MPISVLGMVSVEQSDETERLTLMKTWESSSLSYVSLTTVFLLLKPT